jgi:hypothetical protein
MPGARLAVVAGAGHMGPLTHASEVNAAIARYIAETEARSPPANLPAAAARLERFNEQRGEEVLS